jgi:putative transposase
LSPARRRLAVLALRDRLGMSERRACRLAGQHRSTQRREPIVAQDDAALRVALRQISRERPRWGYRRAHTLLLQDGWELNIKRHPPGVARGGLEGAAQAPQAPAVG